MVHGGSDRNKEYNVGIIINSDMEAWIKTRIAYWKELAVMSSFFKNSQISYTS